MEGMNRALSALFKVLENYDKQCPNCSAQLVRPKTLSRVTGQKMAGACMSCGYKEPPTEPQNNKALTDLEMSQIARKNDATNYLYKYSMPSDMYSFKNRFTNYQANTQGQKDALEFAKKAAENIAAREPTHVLMYGQTGVGKTHLTMGIISDVLERTKYALNVVFVDWRELLDERKRGISDREVKRRTEDVIKQIKRADLVIIDDLGSERVNEYSADTLDEIWRARENKATIVNTNLAGSVLKENYGDRVMSRFGKNGMSYAFKNIQDYRAKK